MLAGLIGVPSGSYMARKLRPLYPSCDPMICAAGLFCSSPLIYLALVVTKYSGAWCFFLVFFAEVSLNLTWSIVADILLVRSRPNVLQASRDDCRNHGHDRLKYLLTSNIVQVLILSSKISNRMNRFPL